MKRQAKIWAGAIASAAAIGLVATPAGAGVGAWVMAPGDIVRPATKAAGVPAPSEFFGFEIGDEGKLAAFAKIKEYLSLIAEKSDEVDYEVVDKTTDGDDFPVVRFSSRKNLDRLDEILEINRRLADAKLMATEAKEAGVEVDEYVKSLAAKTVPVYYVEASIHATEVGTTQALINVAHRLATEDSAETRKILDNMVVLMVPSTNPDGQKMVVDYFNETAGTDYARTYPDLYHRYVGHDNNRDWFMFTQKESRTRLSLEQKYRPVAQHYMHQAGQTSPRIWVPPWDEPLSTAVHPLSVTTSNAIGLEAQKDLISGGLKGVQHDDAYGIMWNADVAGYGSYQGASVWLSEVASNKDLAYTVTDPRIGQAPLTMRNPNPYASDTWTFKQNVAYHQAAAFSGMNSVAEDAQQFLYNNLYQTGRDALNWKAEANTYVISAKQRDPYAVTELLRTFRLGNVEIQRAEKKFSADGKSYPKGSYLISTQQPMGRWVDQLLRIDTYPDSARKCNDGCPLIMPYSETTDNVALFFGVDSVGVQAAPSVKTTAVSEVSAPVVKVPAAKNNRLYVVSPSSYGLGKVISALQGAGIETYRAKGKVKVLGDTLPQGALLVKADQRSRQVLQAAADETGIPVYGLSQAPKTEAIKLKAGTRVGLVRGINNMPGGWLDWMFEQYGTNLKVVEAKDWANLSKNFDTIVLAPGVSETTLTKGLDASKYPERFAWAAGVVDAPAKLKSFAEQGGNVVGLGSASVTASNALGLPVKNVTPTDRKEFNAPGALLKQSYDVKNPTAWGMPASWPSWYNNDPAFTVTQKGATAASYPKDDELLVSGYAKGTAAISGASNVATFDVGKGQATVAGGHITFRTWPRASWTIVTNAVYNGVGVDVDAKALKKAFK